MNEPLLKLYNIIIFSYYKVQLRFAAYDDKECSMGIHFCVQFDLITYEKVCFHIFAVNAF